MIRSAPRFILALGIAAVGLAAEASVALAQEAPCSGWSKSCASVEVHAIGDQLVLFVPNLTAEATDAGEAGEIRDRERLRVYADQAGMTCDPATGAGCLEIDPAVAGSATPPQGGEAAKDPDCEKVDEAVADGAIADGAIAPSEGVEREERRCRERPVAAYFLFGLPAALYVLGPDGEDPQVVSPVSSPGDGGDDGSSGNSGSGGSGGDDGDDGSGG
ncbi:MAG: hypothetical protein ACRELC_01270, partial [Gemmatimonadota bacterium]